MDQDELKGKAKDIKGNLKEGAGKVTGNERLEGEGKAEQVEGNVQETFGRGKRKVGEAADKLTGE